MKTLHFYKDKPLFGFDIGHGSLKVMQLETSGNATKILGYGTTQFDIGAIDNGVIVDPKAIATVMRALFKDHLIGEINTRRIAMALPTYRTFSRSIRLPKLGDKELMEAINLEVEQYIPVALQELYLDYTVTGQTEDGGMELFVVAVPKAIVDSYLTLARMMGLETVLIEPTMASCTRLFTKDENSDIPSVIIDFGSLTADISIFDKTELAIGTVPAGGLVFTEAISKRLNLSIEEAGQLKTKYGLDVSPQQKQVASALEPALQKLVTEIRRMIRYYDDRYKAKRQVGQVVILGGGANMPGLGNYLTNALKIPVRTHNHPWALFSHEGVQPPAPADRLMYVTVAGLALLDPKEVFHP
ncbi:MAG TPA: type IV pilus assembly protein PilM [Candidatus Saccharimonadales bacterium]|nr:type IV pilus assembly protein PilM [Candidatus Saccharimonadales bacterium]